MIENMAQTLKSLHNQYAPQGPPDVRHLQVLITNAKGIALDLEGIGRDSKALSKDFFLWGQNQEDDLKDVTDRLAYLNFVHGTLASTLSDKLDAARVPMKKLRESQMTLAPRRQQRGAIETEIQRLRSQPNAAGAQQKIAELTQTLGKHTADDAPLEREIGEMTRNAVRESERLKWEAFREYAEKILLVSEASRDILQQLPATVPDANHPYQGKNATAATRSALQTALDNWKPGQTSLNPAPQGVGVGVDTRSFGESHASELSRVDSFSSSSTVAPGVPVPASGDVHSPTTGSVAPPAPTVAETGNPIMAGAGGPGPVSGNLSKDSTSQATPAVSNLGPSPSYPPSSGPGDGVGGFRSDVGSTPQSNYESAEDEKRRLQRDERERILGGSNTGYGAGPSDNAPPPPAGGPAPYESAEDEKKRLEREERERILRGDKKGGPDDGKPEPPPYSSREHKNHLRKLESRDDIPPTPNKPKPGNGTVTTAEWFVSLTNPFAPDVIIQMFQWSYDSVAEEFGSPIEHVNGTGWYTPYQPVSYKIHSKFGDRGALASMIQRCKNAGVGVLVDVIWNHMTGGGSDEVGGIAGSLYTKYNYQGLYNYSNFHHCNSPDGQIGRHFISAVLVFALKRFQTTGGITINSSTAKYGVLRSMVSGYPSVATPHVLPSLDTGQEYVQNILAAYGNDLISMGVAGFRLDAIKSIEPFEVTQILSKLTHPVYITQEAPGAPNYLDILKNGDYQEFDLVEGIGNAFQGFDLSSLLKVSSDKYSPSNKAIVFVTNHDRERTSPRLTYKSPDNQYSLAHVWVLGFNYGAPEVLSSYTFSNNDEQGPNGLYGTCKGDGGDNGWLCQHRWPMIAGMMQFRKVVGDADVNTPTVSRSFLVMAIFSNMMIAWGRGDKGFVAINNSPLNWKETLSTKLPDGVYCDVLHGRQTALDTCPGISVKVSGGKFDINLGAHDAVAFHVGAMVRSSVTVTFNVTASTDGDEAVFVTGTIPELGNWDLANAFPLTHGDGNNWSGEITFNQMPDFQYKYIKKTGDAVVWEEGGNRVVLPGGITTRVDEFRG
ncbi:hypothetical protein FRB99_000247 [Tulasnella sp. 403]|nr:hypothetical protein FRB99_000247 [Tulasnella sp. 403]